jgi:RNA recognition motif. (a.k.a. RRM, RBD, or RNP domain)
LIVVDNLPKATKDKVEKLKGVILKTYHQVADYLTMDDVYMPEAQEGSLGFCFIKFHTKETAEVAVQATQGHSLSPLYQRMLLFISHSVCVVSRLASL